MTRSASSAASPNVSVVIPTHNRWALLRAALHGALAQRAVDVEVLVVDDGSTDETADELSRLTNPRLRVIRHETSQGVARARNSGIAHARGEWVAFLDDDDLWSTDKVRAQLDAAARHGAAFVYGTAVEIDEHRTPLVVYRATDARVVTRELLATNAVGTPSAVMVRTELLRRVGGFDERLAALADWDLWLTVLGTGAQATACHDVVVGYLNHADNMMFRDADRIVSEFRYMAAKHRAASVAQGVEFGRLWFSRWVATRHRKAGHHRLAAKAYLSGALLERSAGDLVRALGSLLGERAMVTGRRRLVGSAVAPDWLDLYSDGRVPQAELLEKPAGERPGT